MGWGWHGTAIGGKTRNRHNIGERGLVSEAFLAPRCLTVGMTGFGTHDNIVEACGGHQRNGGDRMGHRDGDPDKTKEEYDQDNYADQNNPNNDEYPDDDE